MRFRTNITNQQRLERMRRCYETPGNRLEFYHAELPNAEWCCNYFENEILVLAGVGQNPIQAFDLLCLDLFQQTFDYIAITGETPTSGFEVVNF